MAKEIVLLFANQSVLDGKTDPQALTALLNQTGRLQASAAILEDLLFYIDNERIEVFDTNNDRLLSDYDAVYFRYWGQVQGSAIAAARYCQLTGTRFMDREVLRVGSQNKITQYVNLHEAGVPIPRTLISNPTVLQANYQAKNFTFPLVVKAVGGTRGKDNFMVRNETELREALATRPEVLWVMQTYIPNDRDYRVVVLGNEVKLVIERRATGDTHLNNTSQGGSAKIVPVETLPADVRELSVRAASFFGRDIAGVDMVRSLDTQQYYCFEVNRSPQIERASFAQEKAELLATYLAEMEN